MAHGVGGHLDLCIPDVWVGRGDERPRRGALLLRDRLAEDRGDFVTADLSRTEREALRTAGDAIAAAERQIDHARRLIETAAPRTILSVLGTAASEPAPLGWLSGTGPKDGPPLAVVWLAAHACLESRASSPDGSPHEMALAAVLGGGTPGLSAPVRRPIDPDRVVLAGVRDISAAEASVVLGRGLRMVSGEDLAVPDPVVAALAAAGAGRVHVHLDLDVLDPAVLPQQHRPVRGGASAGEIAEVLAAVGSVFDVVGASVTGFVPREHETSDELESGLEIVTSLVRTLVPPGRLQPSSLRDPS